MKFPRPCIFAVALASVLSFSANTHAQQTPYVIGSTITGSVYCADTGAPARFAKVLLKSVEPSHAGEDFVKNMQDNVQKLTEKTGASSQPAAPLPDDKKKALAAAAKGMDQAFDMMNATSVGMDGRFSFAGVKPGTYYVHAIYEGYLDPYSQFSDDDFASTDPSVRARMAQIPTVTVSGKDSAHVDLRLERGASVSGRITYDDGTPASGWILSTVKKKDLDDASLIAAARMKQALAISGGATVFKTDDLGHYRISGIAEGEYLVVATFSTPPIGINATNVMDGGGTIDLILYSGNTFSPSAAKSIVISAGEEHTGVDLIVPGRSLHTIVGHLYAKSDGHSLNMGQVALTGKEEPTIHRTAAVRDDGSFHFEYLPSGTYTVKVVTAEEGKNIPGNAGFMGMNIPKQQILHKYAPDTTEVTLGTTDLDNVHLDLAQTNWTPPAKQAGAGTDVSPADLLNGIMNSIPSGAEDSTDSSKAH